MLVFKAARVTGIRVTKSQALSTGERKQRFLLFFLALWQGNWLFFFF